MRVRSGSRKALIAELCQTSIPNINIHIKNILKDGEPETNSGIKEYLTTAADSKNYRTLFYNPGMIPAIGYRAPDIRSHRCQNLILVKQT